jgi:hypothetical protein
MYLCRISLLELLSMGMLTPILGILPPSQLWTWNQLQPTPRDFVLYGGTALGLRLGHRQSVDFDFFSSQSFHPSELVQRIEYLANQRVEQQSENTLSCEIHTVSGAVKISFFGGLTLRQIEPPDVVESNGIAVASLRDLLGTKCATVPQRNELKDYLDIHALITVGQLDLTEGIACAAAIYGQQYNPILTLQALSYFEDLPDELPAKIQAELRAAVREVSLRNLRAVSALGTIGAHGGRL